MTDEENHALHCLGMCADWEGHPAYEDPEHAGLRKFLMGCADAMRWQRDEIERLRVAVWLAANFQRDGASHE